jgi:hypothetical protein
MPFKIYIVSVQMNDQITGFNPTKETDVCVPFIILCIKILSSPNLNLLLMLQMEQQSSNLQEVWIKVLRKNVTVP